MGRQQNELDRDSVEIKQDIRRTRGAMDNTLDELGERLNPRNLLDDVVDIFRSPSGSDTAKRVGESANDFASNLGRQVRNNPIGATLVGAGLAWLAFGNSGSEDRQSYRSNRRDDDIDREFDEGRGYYTDEDLLLERTYNPDPVGAEIIEPEVYGEQGSSESTFGQFSDKAATAASAAGDSVNGVWESTKDAATSAATSVSNAASATGEAIGDAASSVADGVKSTASSVAGTASNAGSATSDAARRAYLRSRAASRDAYRGTARSARSMGNHARSASRTTSENLTEVYSATSDRVQRAHQETPLALGLGFLAIGALTGALIPRTRREDEWMGESSDELISEAQHQAEQAYERGEAAVQRTVEAAKQSADSQGLTSDSLAERATKVVEKVASSVSEAAKEEGLHPTQLKNDAKSVAEEASEQAESEAQSAAAEAKDKAAEVDPDAKKAVDKK